ncbi:MAG TPA: adenylyl-sulfate kinase [Bacteroidia bacterium]|nr:adenylyl-sulfate kinase [Bacteroidia bacterium]
MTEPTQNIHTIFDRLVQREDRERLLEQTAKVFWLTGLSGSGKSTLAAGLQRALHAQGKLVYVLDGDNVRAGINNNLGFSESDRTENIRRISEVAKLFLDAGVITICSFVSPTNELRTLAKNIIGEKDFFEIYINAPLETCEERDVKGLYAKARKGEIKDFTGVDAPFEAPSSPDLELKTNEQHEDDSLLALVSFAGRQVRVQ